jgi:hypothetical protein
VSTDKHSSDPINESPMGGTLDDGEEPAAQQDAEDEVTSGTASTPTAANASSGPGRQPVGPDQGEATLSHPSNRSNDLKGASRPDSDDTRSLAEALDLLRASVDHLVATKRRTTAAAVSLDMRRRSSNTFTPAAIGFTGGLKRSKQFRPVESRLPEALAPRTPRLAYGIRV